jgi:hypothetical protein
MPRVLALALLLAGCTRVEYVPVEVPGPVQRVPVPDRLLRPCLHLPEPESTGEMLEAYEEARTEIAICNEQLRQIQEASRAAVR